MFGTSSDELCGGEFSFDMFRCVCLPVLEELQLGKMQTKLQLKSVWCGLHYGWNLFVFQVANLACSMSGNEDGVKLVRMAAAEIDALCPQVRNMQTMIVCRS